MDRMLAFVLGLLLSASAFAVDTPSTLLITGNVLRGAGVTPVISDTVVVFDPAANRVVAKGRVVSAGGLFSVTVNETSAFNGTPVTLQFQDRDTGKRHQLYESGSPADGGTPANFNYQGGLVPRRVTTTATIGEEVGLAIGEPLPSTVTGSGTDSDGGSGGSDTPAPAEQDTGSPFDVNDDGFVDQLDVQAVKDVVAGRSVSGTILGRADVNDDEIVNTRDIIAVIKAANAAERERLSSNADAAVRRP